MKTKILLIAILILAFGLRFYKLGQIPSGFVNDEAAIGYNAYSLLKTGKDEFGKAWPLVFRSFGEGKLPVYIYLTIPSILIFGLNEFAVRFPSAFFGALTVFLVYSLGFKIQNWKLGISASFILAIMPWHLQFSRAAFEANLALFFVLLAVLLWLLKKYWLSIISFILAIFTYNAARIFVPFLVLYLLIKDRKKIILIVLIPWFLLNLIGNNNNRVFGISILNPQSGVMLKLEEQFRETRNQPLWLTRLFHNKPTGYFLDFSQRYLSHFNPDFLFFIGDPNRPRYRTPGVGQNLLIVLPFLIIGSYLAVKRKLWLILIWLLTAPIASAITFETPSAIRAYFMIIPLVLLSALGLNYFLGRFSKTKVIILILFLFNFFYYLDAYYIHGPMREPYEWQGGYKELVRKINLLKMDYDKFLITDSRGTAYIYFLFFNAYDPAKWQQQSNQAITKTDKFGFSSISRLENLFFISEPCPAKNLFPEDRVLYVCTEIDHPQKGYQVFPETINYSNNKPSFFLFKKQSSI